MNQRGGLLTLLPVAAGLVLSAVLAIAVPQSALSFSTDVNLTVPEGIIEVHGKASPHAQVKLFENGNATPAGSITADAIGNFTSELPQMAAGVITITLQATDTNGIKTPPISKQVAVVSQQTVPIAIVLPPSVTAAPSSIPFDKGTLIFKGRTIPGASVKIRIEPSLALTATADSQGNFTIPLLASSLKSVGIYTYEAGVTVEGVSSDDVAAGTFTIAPTTAPPIEVPRPPLIRFSVKPLTSPTITFPEKSDHTATAPFVIKGQAEPGSIVSLYDNGALIGSVVSDQGGNWYYYFAPYTETHKIHAKTCRTNECSQASRTITIHGPDKNVRACTPQITLETTQLSGTVGKEVILSGKLAAGKGDRVMFVAWGDSSEGRFDAPKENHLKATHTYDKAGIYNGFIIINSGTACQSMAYFAVEVVKSLPSLETTIFVAATIMGLICLGWILLRTLTRR